MQAASLLSSAALSAVLELVQKCCAAARTSKHGEDDARNQQASEQDAQQCAFVLRKLAVLLSSHGLAKQPEMLLPLIDTLGGAARSSCATGAMLCMLLHTTNNTNIRCHTRPDLCCETEAALDSRSMLGVS